MIDNDLKDQCSINYLNKSLERSIKKIDYYLKNFSSFNQKKNLAKVRRKNFLLNTKENFFLFLETHFVYGYIN